MSLSRAQQYIKVGHNCFRIQTQQPQWMLDMGNGILAYLNQEHFFHVRDGVLSNEMFQDVVDIINEAHRQGHPSELFGYYVRGAIPGHEQEIFWFMAEDRAHAVEQTLNYLPEFVVTDVLRLERDLYVARIISAYAAEETDAFLKFINAGYVCKPTDTPMSFVLRCAEYDYEEILNRFTGRYIEYAVPSAVIVTA